MKCVAISMSAVLASAVINNLTSEKVRLAKHTCQATSCLLVTGTVYMSREDLQLIVG